MRRALAVLALLLAPVSAAAEGRPWIEWAQFDEPCGGDCAGSVFFGQWINSAMSQMFLYGDDPVAPWDWEWREDYVLGGALSRRVATLWDVIDLEGEVGTALRFGEETIGEFWIAGYARWTAFPWNDHVRTSFAINTGLSYATGVSEQERIRSKTPSGSRLLHYLAPEITVADPDWERTDLFVRFHHRSGGAQIWGDSLLFNNVSGAAQYWVLGIRRRF
ncbi:MAG: hypothetical protein R6V44_09125 [Paracoccaceae bacterium]